MLCSIPATCLALLVIHAQAASPEDPQGLLQPLPPQGFNALECVPVTASNASVEIYPAAEPVTLEANGVYLRVSGTVEEGLYLGYTLREGSEKVLRTYRSTDGAGSWQRLGDVERGDKDTRDIDNAFPLVLPAGFPGTPGVNGTGAGGGNEEQHLGRRILYAYRNHDMDVNTTLDVPGNYTFYRLSVSASDDGGNTWRFLSHIDERPANDGAAHLNGLWEPFLRVAGDGATLQAFYTSENRADDQDSLLRESSDGGRTWGPSRAVSGAEKARSRDGMTGVARLGTGGDDQRLILAFETTESGRLDIRRVTSPDGGLTWPASTRARVYDPADEEKEASALAGVVNVGGTLVAGFMTNEGTGSVGTVPGDFKVVSSADDGETWGPSVVIARGAIWPGLYSLGGDRFLATWSVYSPDGRHVTATRVFGLRRV